MFEMRRVRQLIHDGIDAGLHLGAQIYVSLRGEVVMDEGIGESRHGVPMTPQSINWWLSCTKPITAVAIAQQWELGRLTLDDPVAKHIPEFAVNGKENVTIRHLLTHTGGFRNVVIGSDDAWEKIIARIAAARLETGWIVGQTAGYHVASSWFILGEIVRRLDGRAFEQYVREAIFAPLGMNDSWIGMPFEAFRAYGDRIVTMYDTSKDPPNSNQPSPTEKDVAAVRPGSNGRGPIRELGVFYESLLRAIGILPTSEKNLLKPQTVEAMIARHRVGLHDKTFNHVMDWGLGFIINSAQYGVETVPYGYGAHASPRAFGHSGNQSSSAFADPEHGLVVAWSCNGMPGEVKHHQRQRAIHTAIYEDLNLHS